MKKLCYILLAFLMLFTFTACSSEKKDIKIGVSLGVGKAERWKKDKAYMEDRAKELGATIEVRLNTDDDPESQMKDCRELIDSGIDVLLLTPKVVDNAKAVVEYAKEKDVKIISYSRIIVGEKIELYVGYDSTKIGQAMGQYLTEKVDKGTYILLKGDKDDFNTQLLYDGALKYINPIKSDLNIILDEYVTGWSPEVAKQLVKEALQKNNKVDAILAPNDKIAEACRSVLDELNIQTPVSISGMDAELNAVKRIINDKQDMTVYLSLPTLAKEAVNAAYDLAKTGKVTPNSLFDNQTSTPIDAFLINGQVITKENIKAQVIDNDIYTEQELYN